jgi:hypothetical protein
VDYGAVDFLISGIMWVTLLHHLVPRLCAKVRLRSKNIARRSIMFDSRLRAAFMFSCLALMLAAPAIMGRTAPPNAATTVTVQSSPDFVLSASPASRTVKRNSGTFYDIQVESLDGFNGTVDFEVSGVPINTTSSVGPAVTGSGTAGLSVQTTSVYHDPSKTGTPIGTFTLTITGTSGHLSHSTQVTLVVR